MYIFKTGLIQKCLDTVYFGSSLWQARRIYNSVIKDKTSVGKCSYGMILIMLIISIEMILLGFLVKFNVTREFGLTIILSLMFCIASKNSTIKVSQSF